MTRTHLLSVVMAIAHGVLWGQTQALSYFNPLSASQPGVHLYGISVNSGYFSSGTSTGIQTGLQTPFVGANTVAEIVATFGESKVGERSSFTWNYSPSYVNPFYANDTFQNHGSFNHSASVMWTRRLTRKWSLSTSLNGTIANLEQRYFNPAVLSSVAAMHMTFDELAAAMLAGKYTDTQLASLLAGTPLQASLQQGYLYGGRMLNAGANVVLSWTPSGKTSVSATLTGTRYQNLNGTFERAFGYVLPQMTTAGASISWSYSLSPRTHIGASVNSTRTFSNLQRGYAPHANMGFGRTMSSRWFMQLTAGVGRLNYGKQTYKAPTTVQYLYGASLGYQTYAHTLLVSYNRTLGDAYGLGSGSTSSVTGAWNWRISRRSWDVAANGGFQQLDNSTFPNSRSWQAGAGIFRYLGPHFTVSAQYTYFEYPGNLRTAGVDSVGHGVMLALTWAPSRY